MAVASIEALTFGLGRLVRAAEARGETYHLLSRDKSVYDHELHRLSSDSFRLIEVDTFDPGAVVSVLRDIRGLRGLMNLTDTWSLVTLAAAAELGLPSQDPASVRLARDKYRLRNTLYERGLSRGGASALDPSAPEALPGGLAYPLVVKDSSGTASKNVWLVEQEGDLPTILEIARDVPLRGQLSAEPYFSGVLYSVETLSWDGEIGFLGVSSRILSREPRFREEALGFPVPLPPDLEARLYGRVAEALRSIGYSRGFAHTEVIHTSEGFEIVEINPRLGGAQVGEAVCRAYGANVYEAFIDMALDEPPRFLGRAVRPTLGVGQALVYAEEVGRFREVRGLDKLAGHPGDPEFYPTMRPGQVVVSLADQSGCAGIVLTTGPSSELALQNAIAAANKLRAVVC